jgi:hypothetical protein
LRPLNAVFAERRRKRKREKSFSKTKPNRNEFREIDLKLLCDGATKQSDKMHSSTKKLAKQFSCKKNAKNDGVRGCQIFHGTTYQNVEKITQITIKYTK